MLPCLCLASGASLASFPCCIAPASVPSLHAHHPASSLCVISSSWKHTSLWVWGPPNPAWGFPGGSAVKNLPACRRRGFDPWVRKVQGEMATHSTILAWEIQWTEEQRGYSSWGHKRLGHDWATKQQWADLLLSNSFEKHLTSVISWVSRECIFCSCDYSVLSMPSRSV